MTRDWDRPRPDGTIKAVSLDRDWLDVDEKVEHLQVFDAAGIEVFEAYWRPTGHFRIAVGWFGIPRVEQEMVFTDTSRTYPAVTTWRRAPRGTAFTILGVPTHGN